MRSGLWVLITLAVLALGLGFLALGLTGKPLRLPVWAVAEVEARLNAGLGPSMAQVAVSVGGIEVMVDDGWVPRLALADLRLLRPGGAALLMLPEVQIAFDPADAARGRMMIRSLRVVGARISAARAADGSFDFAFGEAASAPAINSLDDLLTAADRAFAVPALSRLTVIEAEGLTLSLDDQRAGKLWQVGDGRLRLENRATEISAELGLTLAQDGTAPAQALISLITEKGASSARLTATVQNVAAADLAAQATPLAWLGVLDAPISGRIAASLDGRGVAAFEGQLSIGAGALRPTEAASPILFDRAGLTLAYEPDSGRIVLRELTVDSDSLRLVSSGQGYLLNPAGARTLGPLTGTIPAAFLGQLRFDRVMVDPAGLFESPVVFSEGALDLRLSLSPFRIEIGQLSLIEAGQRIGAKGRIGADRTGWRVALDFALDEISVDRLLTLWPVRLVPKTRGWLASNVQGGQLFDMTAGLRLAPDTEPRLSLGYEFRDTEVSFLKTLPPITSGYGYATVQGKTYTLVLDKGTVTPPEGGPIDMAGSVFAVPDITQKPAQGDITLHTDSSLTAALSLLDQPPFRFMTKAEKPVDLGQGRARLVTHLVLPLAKGITLPDVDYDVRGTLTQVASDRLVPGRSLTADALTLTADPQGLRIEGPGRIGGVPFAGVYTQGFGPEAKGRATVAGTVTLSQAVVDEFNLGFPPGTVSGAGPAQVEIALTKGSPPDLTLTSDLAGIGLAVPVIGWTKPAASTGRLEVAASLGPQPVVRALTLSGGGLEAVGGTITQRPGGGLDQAAFASVRLNSWLIDAPVRITGQGVGRPLAVAIEGGALDLRKMGERGKAGGAGEGGPITVQLDRLQVTSDIALTGFAGEFNTRGGFNGRFAGMLDGTAQIEGTLVPARHGSAVRLQSANAGAVLKAAGVFKSAKGGALDMTLTPRAGRGEYDGNAVISDFRVVNNNVLADLLNAVSVVGLLEQLNGEGIAFATADARFVLTPDQVRIRDGVATGASLGVTLEGAYRMADKRIDLQGVISPIYLVNGIGAMLTRRGEGVIGFNYALTGTAGAPSVSVNPLSLFTPGMFREVFRRAPPRLGRGEE